jgi:predicted nucleic-acid-binding Zn-ribbon protein
MTTNLIDEKVFKLSNIEVITIGVRCKDCGHTWGVRLHGEIDMSKINLKRFMCDKCLEKSIEQPEVKI